MEESRIPDSDWEYLLAFCGDETKSNQNPNDMSASARVLARSYTVNEASEILNLHKETIKWAVNMDIIPTFEDPYERLRIPVYEVNQILRDKEYYESIAFNERIRLRDLADVCNVNNAQMRKKLKSANLSSTTTQWGDIRGRWDIPHTYQEFLQQLKELRLAKREDRVEERKRARQEKNTQKEERRILRQRLLSMFPNWQNDSRVVQNILLHVGEPNSGKTYDALQALKSANSGWYLSPLRLLAFEIFDRLNSEGVLCNLLTGEERIDIPGATITAATIEMFNPNNSGECIIVDEAQMLGDPDRGWAWTRAMMEAQAPEIHIIAPLTAKLLIQNLAISAALPYEIIEHQRLTPIEIASEKWTLDRMPSSTILVAFSRRTVLDLKSTLEAMGREVSVIYGALPPEVRRKQADRFANGETEICIATDAVGMGLNLPADHVCFYEIEKYDGRDIRLLTPGEVHQIGGRAGRFGFSEKGLIGSTSTYNLEVLQELFDQDPEPISYARLSPRVEELELIPGHLKDKLQAWSELQLIPKSLRSLLRTADLNERIELAAMLSSDEIDILGLERAVQLTNAPTRKNTRDYWRDCATAIINNTEMPFPPTPPAEINNEFDLDKTEAAISCADIYLWLGNRDEFLNNAPFELEVRALRKDWSLTIHEALLNKVNTKKRCPNCGKTLPLRYRYRLCNDCHRDQIQNRPHHHSKDRNRKNKNRSNS